MSKQLSDCCKAGIELTGSPNHHDGFKCEKCGRIIGTPLPGEKKMKTYLVRTYSNVKGIQRIKATSPEEAKTIVDAEMKESLDRLLRTTVLHEDVTQISGTAGAEGEANEEF